MSSFKHKKRSWTVTSLKPLFGRRTHDGSSQSLDESRNKPQSSLGEDFNFAGHPLHLGEFAERSDSSMTLGVVRDNDETSCASRSFSTPSDISRVQPDLARRAEEVEKLARLLSQQLDIVTQQQKALEHRFYRLHDLQRSASHKIFESISGLVTTATGIEDKLKAVEVCCKMKDSQMGMVMYSQGVVQPKCAREGPEETLAKYVEQAKETDKKPKKRRISTAVLVLLTASVINFAMALFSKNARNAPCFVRRTLILVEKVFELLSFFLVGRHWNFLWESLLKFLEWMGLNLRKKMSTRIY